ncbi:amidohydrolase family protein [Gilvimarinus polysaccharolyticus]|uniref:amidohydrolase family protein n=1 Tax=Gilvimarinus polysaccharolyticus TaxID=863921 RepID=UPI0006735651|nr:amidohydrolase family protein [Gilvimarinus polysaccharolyticus]
MRRIFSLVMLILGLSGTSSWASPQAASVLIKNVQIVNPGSPLGEPTDVYLEGERIVAIGKVPGQASRVIEGQGRYLIPGLIDTHVHLQGVPGESEQLPAPVREQALAQIPRSYLYFGFTTLLDLISTDSMLESWNQQPLAPQAYHCVGVPIPGGYPLAWIPAEQQLSSPAAQFYLFDERQTSLMATTEGSQAHKVKPLVARIAATKARCIKVFYETGFGRLKNLPVPTVAMMRELVEEAHKYHLPVYLHGNSEQAHEFALQTGVDMLVHGLWHGEQNSVKSLAQRVSVSGLKVQPTLQVILGEQALFDTTFLQADKVAHAMPEGLIEWYRSESGQWMAQQMAHGLAIKSAPDLHQAAQAALVAPVNLMQEYMAELIASNSNLVFGSDTPSGPIYTQFPGLNGYLETQQWLESGVSLSQLFYALTLGNATVLGLEEQLGTVAAGKRADLLLLTSNPLQSARAYDSIEWVILGGVPIAREALSARALLGVGQGDVQLQH